MQSLFIKLLNLLGIEVGTVFLTGNTIQALHGQEFMH